MRKLHFPRGLWLAAALGVGLVAIAQESGSYSFKNFKVYKQGLYRQDSQAYRDGKPFGAPVSDTNCTGMTSVEQAKTIRKMANSVTPNCTTKVLNDTANLAVAEQTCDPGLLQKVIRTTMKVVDDRMYEINTQMTSDGKTVIDTRSRMTYLGTCTPAPVNTTAMQMPKPSKEDCAQLPEMKQHALEGAAGCASMEADYKPRCDAAMQILQQHVKQFEAMCK